MIVAGSKLKLHMKSALVGLIRQLMPKAFIFENVKGLLRQSFSQYFNYIIFK